MSDLRLPTPEAKQPPTFPEKLLPVDLEKMKTNQLEEFTRLEQEMLAMKVELSDVPNSESLVKIYGMQAKGRAYFERCSEIFRAYLKYFSSLTLLAKRATFFLDQHKQAAAMWARTNLTDELKNTKSGAEREAIINALVPMHLFEEQLKWEALEAQARVNFTIVKSYQDQFRGVREEILVQISIIKQLIALGDLKIDAENIRALHIIDAAYTPTARDRQDAAESYTDEISSSSDGMLQI